MRDYATEKRRAKQVYRRARRCGRPMPWSKARKLIADAYDVDAHQKKMRPSKASRMVDRAAWKKDRSRVERNLAAARDAVHAKAKALASGDALVSVTTHRHG